VFDGGAQTDNGFSGSHVILAGIFGGKRKGNGGACHHADSDTLDEISTAVVHKNASPVAPELFCPESSFQINKILAKKSQ